jgi:predicted metal-binding membrane protein
VATLQVASGRRPVVAAAVLAAATLIAWIVTIDRMRGMDAGPGTNLGAPAWFVGIWVTMMAAMMLPSVAPMALLYARVNRAQNRAPRASQSTVVFLTGYFVAWTAYGLAAYGLFRLVSVFDFRFLRWDEGGPIVAGAAIAAAGIYQLTPFKSACLRHCRSPLHFVLGGWREGNRGALQMGVTHGAYCVGCCWGLMVILLALGVMSIVWMAVVAGVIFAEKVFPFGHRLVKPLAVVFLSVGCLVAIAPSAIPGLHQPGREPAMHMKPMTP